MRECNEFVQVTVIGYISESYEYIFPSFSVINTILQEVELRC